MQPPAASAGAARKPRSEFVLLHSDCRARRCARIGAKRSAKLIAQMDHANLCKCPVAKQGAEKREEEMLYVSLAEISESGSCSEEHTAALIRQILIALDYLHSQGVVHGAIRSENIFIEAHTGLIKVALELFVPQVVNGKNYDVSSSCSVDYPLSCLPKVDVWAVGCIAKQLLTGYLQSSCYPSECAYLNRLCGSATIPLGLSLSAAAFLSECLSMSDDDTLSSHELLEHPFMQFPLSASTEEEQEEEDPAFRIDDYPLICDEMRNRPPTPRPKGVPSLKLSAPLLFTTSSQSERGELQRRGIPLGCSEPCNADCARNGNLSARERGISRILFADDCSQAPSDSRKRKASAASAAACTTTGADGAAATARPRHAKVSAGCGRAFVPGPCPLGSVCIIDPPRAA